MRFLGRRVYVAVMLMLASPPQGAAIRMLWQCLSVAPRTVLRWRKWWTQDFQRTPFWQAARSRFMPPLPVEQLPSSLLERFDASTATERFAQALRFLSPMSLALMIK